jgi:hypothetical protein
MKHLTCFVAFSTLAIVAGCASSDGGSTPSAQVISAVHFVVNPANLRYFDVKVQAASYIAPFDGVEECTVGTVSGYLGSLDPSVALTASASYYTFCNNASGGEGTYEVSARGRVTGQMLLACDTSVAGPSAAGVVGPPLSVDDHGVNQGVECASGSTLPDGVCSGLSLYGTYNEAVALWGAGMHVQWWGHPNGDGPGVASPNGLAAAATNPSRNNPGGNIWNSVAVSFKCQDGQLLQDEVIAMGSLFPTQEYRIYIRDHLAPDWGTPTKKTRAQSKFADLFRLDPDRSTGDTWVLGASY